MKWLRTGRKISQAVKNVQRLRQIISVFAKYGFVDVVERMRLERFLTRRLRLIAEAHADLSPPERLRKAFEELGPAFVKLGQLLSTRPDIIPESFVEELSRLQDNVRPLSFDVVREVVEKELGRPLEQAYASFEHGVLASASIGQVHEARLHTGEKVVVKVQRPDIARVIKGDVSLLAFLAGLLEKYVPESRVFAPKIVVDEFFRTLSYELDFKVEANNMQKIAENLSTIPEVAVPRVYRDLSTSRVLTQERFEGIRVNDLKALDAAGIDRKQVVQVGARAFFKAVMLDGLFHGDLHGGNLFILPGNRLGIIDFGIVGRLSEKSRDQFASMIAALLSEDYEHLCYLYADLGGGATGPAIDFEGFQREVRNTLAPYMGLSLKDLNAGRILIEATKIAAKFNIKVPGDWMLVFKAIVTIEGMGRTLDPDFDLMASGRELVQELVKNQYSFQKIGRDLMWVAKDAAALLQTLPRQIRWMMRRFEANEFAVEVRVPQLDDVREQLDVNGRRMGSSVLVAGAFVASAIALQHGSGPMVWDYPLAAVIFFVLGVVALLRLFLKSL